MEKIVLLAVFLFFFCPLVVSADNSIAINEFLSHPNSRADEWIEFYNPTGVDLANYWIDDDADFTNDAGNSAKKQLNNIGNSLYPVFILTSSMFNNSSDHVVLFDPTGVIIDQYEYTTDPGTDISIGRNPNGTGQFALLANSTKGFENSSTFPTVTLTPTKTPSPTKTPTPTHSSAQGGSGQVKTPSVTRSPTITSVKTPNPIVNTKTAEDEETEEIVSHSEWPTSVLGASTAASPTQKIERKSKIMVDSATQDNSFTGLFFIIGAVFLLACGILVYRNKMSREAQL